PVRPPLSRIDSDSVGSSGGSLERVPPFSCRSASASGTVSNTHGRLRCRRASVSFHNSRADHPLLQIPRRADPEYFVSFGSIAGRSFEGGASRLTSSQPSPSAAWPSGPFGLAISSSVQ